MERQIQFDELIEPIRTTESFVRLETALTSPALDKLRGEFKSLSDQFDRHCALCAQIGATNNADLRDLLIQVRERLEAEMFRAATDEIQEASARSLEEGWRTFLANIATAVASASALGHALRLSTQSFPFDALRKDALAELREAIECMLDDRWDEAYEQIEWLAQQDYLPIPDRATLLSWIGQIDLFWFEKPARCRARLEMAKTMVPDNASVLTTWGYYFQRIGESEKAKAYYERAIRLARDKASGYVGLGDLVDADPRLNEQDRNKHAEHWYREAISLAGGESTGYSRLLRLLGRPQNLPTRESEFLALVETMIAVNPGGAYQTYVDIGDSYLSNKRFSEAKQWYDKAISLQRDGPRAYTALAQWRREQGDDEATNEAVGFCQKAITVAPQALTGYLSLANIHEEKSEWAKACNIYENIPGLNRPLGGLARASIGRMQWKLGNCEKAESLLFEELYADKEESYACRFLEEIAIDYYQNQERQDTVAAKRVFANILRILGESYRGSYHNRLGNMYYFLGEYNMAVEEYRTAIAAAPREVVYQRNLSKGYELLQDYENACHALARADEIEKDPNTHAQMARLKNLQGNQAYGKGDYEAAKSAFKAAVEFDSSEPVYYTNVAAAWKQLKVRGQRGRALGEARRWYEDALKVADKPEYREEINRLTQRIDLARSYGEKALDYINLVTPIAVEVASDLVPLVEGKGSDDLSEELAKLVAHTRTNVRTQLGLNMPGIRFRGNEGDLPTGNYIVMINEVPLVLGKVLVDCRFFSASEEILADLNLSGESASDPLTGEKGVWIGEADWTKLQGKDFTCKTPMQYIMRHVEALVQKNSSEFLGHQEVVNLIEESQSIQSKDEIKLSPEKLAAFTTAGRALLAEEISIQPFAELCATVANVNSEGRSLSEAVEAVRALPAFRDHLPGKDSSLPWFKLTDRLEEHLRRSLYEQDGRTLLAMEPEHCQKVLAALNQTGDQSAALIVQRAPRPLVRKLVELQSPKLQVLSAQDLPSENLEKTQIIDIEDEPPEKALQFRTPRRFIARANKDAAWTASAASEVSINVFVSQGFEAQESVADDKPLPDLLAMMTEGLYWELGIILPEVRPQIDPSLDIAEFRLGLNGAEPARFTGLQPDEFLVNESAARLKTLGIEATEHENPANENESAKVRSASEKAPTCRSYGLTTWGPHGYLVLRLSAMIRQAAAQFQTDDMTAYMLDLLAESFPDMVRPALQRYGLSKLSAVLRELLSEEISIRDLRGILESLLSINGTTDVDFTHFIVFLANTDRLCPAMQGQSVSELTPAQLADFVRTSLHRYISHKYTRGRSSLIVYLLDTDIERRLMETETRPLSDEERQKFFAAIRAEMDRSYSGAVILTGIEIRRALRRLLASEFPRLSVLCYQELSPELSIQPLGRISLLK
jgi:flagellar biosynthesis component FlhA/lipopolysaccharide biosynthesis regulator YciM